MTWNGYLEPLTNLDGSGNTTIISSTLRRLEALSYPKYLMIS